ncbi:MAG: hypothetical protein Kow0068_25880 [Marinilabiliales bacterium]
MKIYYLIFGLFLINLFFLTEIQSQHLYIPLNSISRFNYEKKINSQSNSHPSVLPYFLNDSDSINLIQHADGLTHNNNILNYLTNKNFIYLSKKNFWLKINPFLQFYQGYNIKSNNNFSHKSAGIHIESKLATKLFSEASLTYNNSLFDSYFKSMIDSTNVIPGYEKYNHYNGKSFDYTYKSFKLTYTPTKYFTTEAGIGKHFLGHGYRSLFLSDNGANYPYIKAYVEIWKVKYIVIYNFFKDVNTDLNNITFFNKYATTHYLSWNIGNRINLNLFESVIWRGSDSLGTRGYDVNYWNPIIFFRPVEFSLGSPDNVIMGIGGKIRIWKNTHIYSQLILDEFKLSEIKAQNGWFANKFGIQLGIKSYNFIKINGLFFLSEINVVRPFTYSHKGSLENYGHYFQPLAHPIGANFIEPVIILKYQNKNYYSYLKSTYTIYGQNPDSINYGQNIYLPYIYNSNEYGNTLLQGIKTNIFENDFIIGYILNPYWNLSIEAGIKIRTINSNLSNNNTFILFGIKTNLINYRY